MEDAGDGLENGRSRDFELEPVRVVHYAVTDVAVFDADVVGEQLLDGVVYLDLVLVVQRVPCKFRWLVVDVGGDDRCRRAA